MSLNICIQCLIKKLIDKKRFYGYAIDMMDEIAKKLNVSYKIHEVPDGSTGLPLPNKSWTGMIGELMTNVRMSVSVTDVRMSVSVTNVRISVSVISAKTRAYQSRLFNLIGYHHCTAHLYETYHRNLQTKIIIRKFFNIQN